MATLDVLQRKLSSLNKDGRITSKMRTHLRTLLLNELQNDPDHGLRVSSMGVRDRALGAIIVDWLLHQNCHYTLSVLSSEVPCLCDLSTIVNGLQKFEENEINEILTVLGMKCDDIWNSYNNQNLLSAILSISATWNQRLAFQQSLLLEDDLAEAEWCLKLRQILAAVPRDPNANLTSIYLSVVRLFRDELNKMLVNERQVHHEQLQERERSMEQLFKEKEDKLKSDLVKMRIAMKNSSVSVQRNTQNRMKVISQLLQEVEKQHKAVLQGLLELEEREKQLNTERQMFQQKAAINELQQQQFRKEMDLLLAEIDSKRQSLLEKEIALNAQVQKLQKQEKSTIKELPDGSDNKKTTNLKIKDSRAKRRERKLFSSLSVSSSSTSLLSSKQLIENGVAVSKRLNELRAETKKSKEEFENVSRVASDSESETNSTMKVYKHTSLTTNQMLLEDGYHLNDSSILPNLALNISPRIKPRPSLSLLRKSRSKSELCFESQSKSHSSTSDEDTLLRLKALTSKFHNMQFLCRDNTKKTTVTMPNKEEIMRITERTGSLLQALRPQLHPIENPSRDYPHYPPAVNLLEPPQETFNNYEQGDGFKLGKTTHLSTDIRVAIQSPQITQISNKYGTSQRENVSEAKSPGQINSPRVSKFLQINENIEDNATKEEDVRVEVASKEEAVVSPVSLVTGFNIDKTAVNNIEAVPGMLQIVMAGSPEQSEGGMSAGNADSPDFWE